MNLPLDNSSRQLNSQRTPILSVLAFIYLSFLIIIFAVFGPSPLAYIAFALVAAVFILPGYYSLGLSLIIILTVLFERFFTLTPLIIEPTIIKLYPLDIIIGLTLIAWIINCRWGRIKPKLFWGWPETILLFFIGGVMLYLIRALLDINADLAVAVSSVKNYAFYPLLYFLTIYSVQTKKQLTKLVHLLLMGGAGLIVFLIIGLMNGQGLWTEFTPLSTLGVRFLAGTHAFYLCLITLIAISLLSFKKFSNTPLIGWLLLIWLTGIFLSLMRHLWLALFLTLALLFISLPRKNKTIFGRYLLKSGLVIITAATLIIFLALIFPHSESINNLATPLNNFGSRFISLIKIDADSSINWRLAVWNFSREAWQNHPWFGVGFGHKILMEIDDWQSFEEIRNIHNSPLSIMVQMGLAGLLAFLAAVAAIIIASWRKILINKELKPYYLGLMAGLGLILLASLFQPYLETNLTGIFLWLFLGLIRTSEVINQYEDSANQ